MGPWLAAGMAALCLVLPASTEAQTSLAELIGGCLGVAPGTTITADPSSYRSALAGLGPGERLLLDPGTYTQGLPVSGLNGAEGACIVIEGPAEGPRAILTGRDCCNTVSILDSSYVVVRNLELDGQGLSGDGVKAEFGSSYAHHITLENLHIHGHDANQQIVGINTKSRAWNWVIRHSVIDGAGTGIYLGNSDGEGEFVQGLIEHNLIQDTTGYNMQIKHQNGRNTSLGMPASATTIIRHNVFVKAQNGATGGAARPNLLVGHWPLSGAGSSDTYQIYGNLFYQNPTETLFQGEGNIALHDNLLINDAAPVGFTAVAIRPHNDVPKAIDVFHNTVVTSRAGISISGGDTNFQQSARANAVFSGVPSIVAPSSSDNVTDSYANAANYLTNPTATLGAGLDLFPLVGTLTGNPANLNGLSGYEDWDRDFNAAPRDGTFRGGYAGEGANPGWVLDLSIKPEILPATADLAISKTNHTLVSVPGTTTTFEIRVTNGGPDGVSGAIVVDDFDPTHHDVSGVSFTCTTSTGAGAGTSCPPTGTGAELDAGVAVNIESGDGVSFSVDTPVSAGAFGLIFNLATVSPPATTSDPEMSNNTDVDGDGVPGNCGSPSDLYLADDSIGSTTSFEACRTLSAGNGFEILASGALTLRSGEWVSLRNGFTVRTGALLTVVLDPSLAGS